MSAHRELRECLQVWARSSSLNGAVGETVLEIAAACAGIAEIIAGGPLTGNLDAVRGANIQGETQKELDLLANDALLAAARRSPVAAFASEELAEPLALQPHAPLAVAVDPLDGSSNIATNVAIGTIFSVLPAVDGADAMESFLVEGRRQLAAGYVLYGPSTMLALTVGQGVDMFVLDRASKQFRRVAERIAIPATTQEFAINAANFRHWNRQIRNYVEDCLKGHEGPRGTDFNTRWIASLVADVHRILCRGGVYLYPADGRRGYESGRLRLVYEANPVGFLIEQAGGVASDGVDRISSILPQRLHQRVPLIFGSRAEVARINRYVAELELRAHSAPLFGTRGLFTA